MQKKTKIIAGVSTLVVAGLLVGLSFQGNLDQLQGRFTNTLKGKTEITDVTAINQKAEDLNYEDYLDKMDALVSAAELAYDKANNAYLVATIPGLQEEGPEDYANHAAIVFEEAEVLETLDEESLALFQEYYATRPDGKPAAMVVWGETQMTLDAESVSISQLNREVRTWTYDL